MKNNVLVVGAGGAGLVAALHAHEAGAKVSIITKDYPTRSQTCMAQGGINAVLPHAKDDSILQHIQNTLKSAHGLASTGAVEKLCTKAPEAVAWLDSIGVQFSRTPQREIAQRRLGGASGDRACYAQDYTGLKILHTLYDKVIEAGIEIHNERHLLSIISDDAKNCIHGVCVLNKRSGEVEKLLASSIILATGGYARVYDKHSTNSAGSTGDGVIAAYKAGAKLSDMEFVQFHPTALKGSAILISESARGAGGHLLNSKGKRFVDELLPRDEVARAIDKEIKMGENIFLDIRHLGETFIDEELPQERKLAILYEGVDPVHELIPIKPVAHYTMGGIEVDENSCTNIKGLYAVGECANHKVHGANRLGGNSLLELIVFGKEAGTNAAKYAQNFKQNTSTISKSTHDAKNIIENIQNFTSEINFYEKRASIGDLFYEKVGIQKTKKELLEALKEIQLIKKELSTMGPKDKYKIYNTNLVEFLEFINMIELSEIILASAIAREESRGAHFRVDAPNEDDNKFKLHTIVYQQNNSVHLEFGQ